MEIITIQKYIHTSPRKLRLVSDMVRKMQPARALDVLRFTPKAAAKDLEKALRVVLANAKQGGMDIDKASFKKIEINESMKMRRVRAGTRGRAKPYKKRMSHIKIVLTDDLSSKLKVPAKGPLRQVEDEASEARQRRQSEKLEKTNKAEKKIVDGKEGKQ